MNASSASPDSHHDVLSQGVAMELGDLQASIATEAHLSILELFIDPSHPHLPIAHAVVKVKLQALLHGVRGLGLLLLARVLAGHVITVEAGGVEACSQGAAHPHRAAVTGAQVEAGAVLGVRIVASLGHTLRGTQVWRTQGKQGVMVDRHLQVYK